MCLQQHRVGPGGDATTIQKAFGAQWDVRLGRVDSDVADPAGRVPPPGASVQEIRTFLMGLAAPPSKGGPFEPKPPFWDRPAFVLYPSTTDSPQVRSVILHLIVPVAVGPCLS